MAKKIAVVAANGRVAGKVIAEAVSRGFDVTGFGRKENNTKAQHYVQKDLFELTKEDLQGFDAVVDAAGAWTLDTMYVIPKAAIYLADLLKGTETRLVVVGGAGSLYVNKEHTSTVELQPTFPDSYKPVSAAHGLALAELQLTLNSRNESIISYADYALAMVDEIEKGNHIQQRISVVRA